MPKVLLVDDSKTIHKVAGLILKGSPYTLLSAQTPEEAQILAAQMKPEIALVDLTIGPTGGVNLIQAFKQTKALSQMKTALLYIHFKELQSDVLLQAGADDKLEKPFDAKSFLALLDKLVSQAPRTIEVPKIPELPRNLVEEPQDEFKSLFDEEEVDEALAFLEKPLSDVSLDSTGDVTPRLSSPDLIGGFTKNLEVPKEKTSDFSGIPSEVIEK